MHYVSVLICMNGQMNKVCCYFFCVVRHDVNFLQLCLNMNIVFPLIQIFSCVHWGLCRGWPPHEEGNVCAVFSSNAAQQSWTLEWTRQVWSWKVRNAFIRPCTLLLTVKLPSVRMLILHPFNARTRTYPCNWTPGRLVAVFLACPYPSLCCACTRTRSMGIEQ